MLFNPRIRALLAALLFFCVGIQPLTAQSIELPKEVKVPVGRLAPVTLKYDGDDVRWGVFGDVDVFREYDVDPKVVRLRVIGYSNSECTFIAIAIKGTKLGDFVSCPITVGTGKPVEPKPVDPKPVDPKPVDPDPNPDVVVVPPELAAQLQTAYLTDPDPLKKDRVVKYALLLKSAVPFLKQSGQVKTAKDFDDTMRSAVEATLGGKTEQGILPNVRRTIGGWLTTRLNTNPSAPADLAYWIAADTSCAQVAKALLDLAKN